MADERRGRRAVLTHALPMLAAAALLAGCTGTSEPGRPDALPPAPPPSPPAACVLDTAAFSVTTGLTWIPDATTASDTRCVYDPSGAAPAGDDDGPAFIAIDVAPAGAADPSDTLDSVAGLCEDNSRANVTAGGDGFVCRFQGGSVFGATVRDDRLITLAASAVPLDTTAARLVTAFGEQLRALR